MGSDRMNCHQNSHSQPDRLDHLMMKFVSKIPLLKNEAGSLTGSGIHNIIGLIGIPLDRVRKTKITHWLKHIWNPEKTVYHMVTDTHIRSSIARNIHFGELVKRCLNCIN